MSRGASESRAEGKRRVAPQELGCAGVAAAKGTKHSEQAAAGEPGVAECLSTAHRTASQPASRSLPSHHPPTQPWPPAHLHPPSRCSATHLHRRLHNVAGDPPPPTHSWPRPTTTHP